MPEELSPQLGRTRSEITFVRDELLAKLKDFEDKYRVHIHDGNFTERIDFFNIFGYEEGSSVEGGVDIGTAAAGYDAYFMVTRAGTVTEIQFSGLSALAANDTNYITWTIVNSGQSGGDSTAMLGTGDDNTTKATGGSAIVANAPRTLTLTATLSGLKVSKGDMLNFKATVTNTLANSVPTPIYLITIRP